MQVVLNEAWGPVTNAAGQAVAGAAAAHVIVDSPTTRLDIFVGYTATAVPDEDPRVTPFPAWVHP